MIKYHIIALFGGFLLDLLVGDPHWMPHPIRLIGSDREMFQMESCGIKKR